MYITFTINFNKHQKKENWKIRGRKKNKFRSGLVVDDPNFPLPLPLPPSPSGSFKFQMF